MPLTCDRSLLRLALIGVLAASLGLAACGRKGPLDAPPGASLAGEPQPYMPELMSTSGAPPVGSGAKDGYAGVDSNGRPIAPKGQKKQIPLDTLLN